MTKTIICDIDGTLIEQMGDCSVSNRMLPGTREKFKEWDRKGYRIILITGRRECSRRITEQLLEDLGLYYDQLVMGVGIGPRVLINDLKPDHPDLVMAKAYNLERNTGIGTVDE